MPNLTPERQSALDELKAAGVTLVGDDGRNALDSVNYELAYDSPFSSEDFRKIDFTYDRALFPRRAEGRRVRLMFSEAGQMQQVVPNGFVYERIHDDGSLDRQLTVQNGEVPGELDGQTITRGAVSVQLGSYSQWQHSWSENALKYFQSYLKSAVDNNRRLATFGLTYNNTFAADQNNFPAIKNLTRENNSIVPERLRSLDGHWHNFSGWFDLNVHRNAFRILEKLEVQVIDGVLRDSANLSTLLVIKTEQVFFFKSDDETSHSMAFESNGALLTEIAHILHDRTKATMTKLLSPNVGFAIGVTDER